MLLRQFKLKSVGTKVRWLLLAFTTILGPISESQCTQAESADREHLNIISIVTDDQAAWTLSCYGGQELLTPNIDRIASEGARFTNAFVATPALLGKWHLGREPTKLPSQFGFESFFGFLGAGTLSMTPVFDFPEGRRKLVGCTADLISDEAIAFIKTKRDQPFALCMHFREPQELYGPMPEVDTQSLAMLDPALPNALGLDSQEIKQWRREYLTAVHAIDRNLGRVFKTLEEQDLWVKTVILFTSDHGYSIGEHTIHGKGNATCAASGLSGPRCPNLWDTSLRVPLLVRLQNQDKTNAVIENVISSVDIFSSVLGMLGVQSPSDRKNEGIDFSPLLKDTQENKNILHWGSVDKLTVAQKNAYSELDEKLHAWMVSIGDPLLAKSTNVEKAKP